MVPIVPKFERSCFNYPNMTEAVGICPNVSNCMQIKMKKLCIEQWPIFQHWGCYPIPWIPMPYAYVEAPKRLAQLQSLSHAFQLSRSTGQKRQNWYDLAGYTSETKRYTTIFFWHRPPAMSNQRLLAQSKVLCGPVEGFVRPSRRFCAAQSKVFRCSKSILHMTTVLILIILNLTFLVQVIRSATLSHLLPLQLGIERLQYINVS